VAQGDLIKMKITGHEAKYVYELFLKGLRRIKNGEDAGQQFQKIN
jgi:hypothetical protein